MTMNNLKKLFILLILTPLANSCTNQNNVTTEKKALIEKLIVEAAKTSIKGTDKVVILKTEYCLQNDCDAYFKEYEDKIILYTKEELFMRGLSTYNAIMNIDNRSIKIIKRNKQGGKRSEEILLLEI